MSANREVRILIMHCHTNNRGDEAAIHSLVGELSSCFKDVKIVLAMRGKTRYPNMPENVRAIAQYIPGNLCAIVLNKLAVISNGRILASGGIRNFVNEIKNADIVLHAPGGPSIGDTYYDMEPTYLRTYDLVKSLSRKYMFYAPSMGPFEHKDRNAWRKAVVSGANAVVLRDPISVGYVRELFPEMKIQQTLDSVFQHDIDLENNQVKLNMYAELNKFLNSHVKCIGITITDLVWHPIHSKNSGVIQNIHNSFRAFLDELVKLEYGIIFIPQLYGDGNDYDLMKNYIMDEINYFIIPDSEERYDSYFQQYIISCLYAVVGMRYHSNIFSAKMATPFISISYEQKMQGFMKKMGLEKYCIGINELSAKLLIEKFNSLCKNHENYKEKLHNEHNNMKKESFRTTEILLDILKDV